MTCRILGISKVCQSKKGGTFIKVAVSYLSNDDSYVGEDVMSLFVFDSLKCFERFACNPQSCKGQVVTVEFMPSFDGRAKLQDIVFSKVA